MSRRSRRRGLSRITGRLLASETGHRLAAWAIARYMRFIFRTTRWTHDGTTEGQALIAGRRIVVLLWHNRVALMPFGWHDRQRPLTALISSHRDGRLLADALASAGVGHIRVPAQALGQRDRVEDTRLKLEAARTIRAAMDAGSTIGIAGDGPVGPRFQLKPTVLMLARMANAEITLVTYSVKRRIVARSWDRLVIPLPFNRGVFRWGAKFYDPRRRGHDNLEALRREIERDLTRLTDETDRTMGHDPIA